MKEKELQKQLDEAHKTIAILQKELEEMNRGVTALNLELEDRVDKRTEEVRKNEERFRDLFNSISSGVAIFEVIDDGKAFVFRDFNKAGEKIDNIDKSEVLGRDVIEVFPGVKEMGLIDVFRRVYKTGKQEESPFVFYKDRRIEGWRSNYVYKLSSNKLVAVYNDITEQKKAEEEIQKLAIFPSENPNPVLRVANDGTVIYANAAAAPILRVWQCEPGERIRSGCRFHITDTVQSGQIHYYEHEVDGRVFAVDLVPIKDRGYVNVYARDITDLRETEQALRRIQWMLRPRLPKYTTVQDDREEYIPPYGDVVSLNVSGEILNAVGQKMLSEIVGDYLDLLDTSAAVYEKNGDYALGLFASGWCRFMDQASRNLCGTEDNREALAGCKWICHESCWTDASKASIVRGVPVDIECDGGIRIYAVPVRAGDEIVGSINFGYGDPPRDRGKLEELATKFNVKIEELIEHANSYETRPAFIIDIAKKRIETSARLIGEIVERKRADERLKRYHGHLEELVRERTEELYISEERFRTAFEHAAIGKAFVNLDGAFLQVNPLLCNILGYTEKELCSKTFQDITHPDDLEADLGMVKQLLAGEIENYDLEKRYYNKDGDEVWVLLSASLVRNNKGKPLHFIAEIQDINERKKAEEAINKLNADLRNRKTELEAVNEELEAFAYSVSHDLRSPLRGVDGYSKLLLEDYSKQLDEDGQFMLTQVRESALQMGQLIDDLLTFSRMSRREMKLQPCDMNNIVHDLFREMEQGHPGRHLRMETDKLPSCTSDPAMIREVVRNLLDNAVKFTRTREEAVINVGSIDNNSENDSDSLLVTFYVEDNGVGFDPKYSDKLFQVFQRLHRAEEFEGTGIGLALVQRIIHRHDGQVWAESEPDKGATFYFSLPKNNR